MKKQNMLLRRDIAERIARRILANDGWDPHEYHMHASSSPRAIKALKNAYDIIEIYEAMAEGKEIPK